MTKITIIDVEINDRVQEIISGEIKQITQNNREDIDNAIEMAKSVENILTKRAQKEKNINDKMEKAYKLLVETPSEAPEILKLILPEITTLSAFTLRMKKYLKSQGDKYTLQRDKNIYSLKRFGE